MYKVIAYDTDYGFETSWDFDSLEAAQEWARILNFDYGNGTAVVVEKEVS